MPMFEQNAVDIAKIFSLQNILIYLVAINLIGFFIMFWDKRKAQKGSWRTPEKTLITISLIGGSIGTLIGMYIFHHKTKKPRFKYGFPAILILQIVIVITFFVS